MPSALPVMLLLVTIFSASAQAAVNLKKLEKHSWVKVSTDNFTVISDKGEKSATTLAENLEQFRLTFKLLGTVALPQDSRPVKVITVSHKDSYKMLVAGSENLKRTSGFFADQISGNYAVVYAGRADSKKTDRLTATSVLFHEYTHFLAASLSSVNLPYWYNEGFADYLSVVKFPDDTTISLGLPIEYHLNSLAAMRWRPIEEVLKATYVSHQDRKDRYRMYSQGWLMIHYMNVDSSRAKQLDNYLNLLANGADVDAAFQQAFSMPFAQLDKALKKYKQKRRFAYSKFILNKPWSLEGLKVEKLSTGDALYELGELLLNGRNDHPSAKALFERTLQLDPTHASALAGKANVLMFGELDKANEAIERAKALEDDNAWVSTISGHINARYARNAANNDEDYTRYWNLAVKDYNHAINAAGINLEALSSAAELYMSVGRWEKAKSLLEIAYSYAPSNYALKRQLIFVNLRLGNLDQAEKVIQSVKLNNHMSDQGMKWFDDWLEKQKEQTQRTQKSPS